jgi:predicted ArsR family transcriptional regulator
VDRLKRSGPSTSAALARDLGLTEAAVRQHLAGLEEAQLVERSTRPPKGRGRPATLWSLTALATELFPDRHADLTVELIAAIRESVGEVGLERVVASRAARQLQTYRRALPEPGRASVKVRVRRLAELRSAEGYLAEAVPDGADMLLVEHHCPICDAAATCQGLCRAELELFQQTLGDDVTVERTQHVLSGDLRCAYRISPRSPATAAEPVAQATAAQASA